MRPLDIEFLGTSRAAAYRALLDSYPLAWRRQHGEALLGTLLDVDDARGGTGPTPAEARDLLVRGLRVRLAYLAPGRRTRELAAALALAFGTAMAVVCVVLGEWWTGPDGSWNAHVRTGASALWWPFASAAPAYLLLWPLALLTLVTGRGRWWGRPGRWLLVIAAPLGVVVYTHSVQWGLVEAAGWPVVGLAGLGLVAGLAGPPRSTRHGTWLLAGTATLTLTMLLDAVRIIRQGPRPVAGAPLIVIDRPGYHLQMQLYADALVVVIVVLVMAAAVAWWWRRWFPALLLVASALTSWVLGPVALLMIAVQTGARIIGWDRTDRTSPAAWLVALAVCGVVTGWAIRDRWRHGRPVTDGPHWPGR